MTCFPFLSFTSLKNSRLMSVAARGLSIVLQTEGDLLHLVQIYGLRSVSLRSARACAVVLFGQLKGG